MNQTSNHTQLRGPGLPGLAVAGLAALGLPRVILHDLHLIPPTGLIPAVLAILPPVVWVVVAVARRVPRPFLTLLLVGAVFGVLLAGTHQVLWEAVFASNPPVVGGSTLMPRVFAVFSGIFTGTVMGALSGLVASGLIAVRSKR